MKSRPGNANKAVDMIVRGYNTIINSMLSDMYVHDSKNFSQPKKQDKSRVQRTKKYTTNRPVLQVAGRISAKSNFLFLRPKMISWFYFFVRGTPIYGAKIIFIFS